MRRGGTVSGAVSLIVIFGVLCMAVFAALTFATANRERTFAELDARRAAEFYQADTAAAEIAASLRVGDRSLAEKLLRAQDAFSELYFTEEEEGTLAEFSLPAGGEQRLNVQLLLRGGELDVLRWERAYAGTWETDETISLAEITE